MVPPKLFAVVLPILTLLAVPASAVTVSLGDALDSDLPWTTGGAAAWSGQTAVSHDGADAAASGTVSHGQTSWVETTVEGPGSLFFWWRVSSERGFDFLECLVDGLPQPARISGEIAWRAEAVAITQGVHTVRWQYRKDAALSAGSDRAWLDRVVFASPPTVSIDDATADEGDGTGALLFNVRLSQPSASDVVVTYATSNGNARSGGVLNAVKIANGHGGLPRGLRPVNRFAWDLAPLGDINGDGIGDVLAGTCSDDAEEFHAGSAWVVLLGADGACLAAVEHGSGRGGLPPGVLMPGDEFGASVASLGDINGDGIGDYATGCPGADDGMQDAGAVWIVMVGPDGRAIGSVKIANGCGGLPAGTLAAYGSFGRIVRPAGDVNGDGVTDLLVSSLSGSGGEPSVWVLLLNGDGTASDAVELASGLNGMPFEPMQWLGWDQSLSLIGDVDGNGVPDFAAGAPYSGGAVWIVRLAADGTALGATYLQSGTNGIPAGLTAAGDGLGATVCGLGDMDGDGVPDLAAGMPFSDKGGTVNAGAVCVMRLNSDGTAKDAVVIANGFGGMAGGLLPDHDWFGNALAAAGDVNDDGVTDLAVGCAAMGQPTGEMWMLLLLPDGTAGSAVKIANGSGGLAPGTLNGGAAFASVLAPLGDLNGDGTPDLAVGAFNTEAGAMPQAGLLWTFLIETNGSVEAFGLVSDGLAGFPTDPFDEADLTGFSLAGAGDIDHDGVPDLVVGAPGSDGPLGDNSGKAWVMLLDRDGTVRAATALASGWGGGVHAFPEDSFGSAVAGLGDVDGDGTPDLAIGAPGNDGGEPDGGAVWIALMQPDGTCREAVELEVGHGIDPTGPPPVGLGSALAPLGDIDGDGVPDLAAAAPYGLEARIAIILLQTNGMSKSMYWLTRGWYGLPDGPPQDFAGLGASLSAVGDVDGDGVTDLAAGAPSALDSDGITWLMLLSSNGTAKSAVRWADGSGGIPTGSLTAYGMFGQSLAATGDVDGDGVPDVAVGAMGYAEDAPAGCIRILLLNGDGTCRTATRLTDGASVIPFGSLVGPGDIDGNGVPDLMVGMPEGGEGHTGAVAELLLDASGSVLTAFHLANGSSGMPPNGVAPWSSFGSCLAVIGDVNGDGRNDIACGAPYSWEGGWASGAAWVLPMDAIDFLPATGSVIIPAGETGATIKVLIRGDRLHEPAEGLLVWLLAATHAALSDAVAAGLILDNDQPPGLFFTLRSIRATDAGVRLAWQATNGWRYSVQRTDSLTGTPEWVGLAPFVDLSGVAGTMEAMDSAPTPGCRFYRVIAE